MTTSKHLKIGVCMSLSFWGCVLWAIIETVIKADNYWVRFDVAMACIGLDVLGFLWLFFVLLVKYISDNKSITIDAGTQPVIAMPLVIPWLIVEVQVEDLVQECNMSDV